jgi:hypothetical protein
VKRRGLPGALGIFVIAAVAAVWIVAGSAGKPGPPPFSVSVSEPRAECLQGTFLPSWISGWKVQEEGVPRDWSRIEKARGAMQAGRAAVEVTISPKERGETVTLTGIRFDVIRIEKRPLGMVFYRPCKRRVRGAAIQAELGLDPRVDSSSAARDGVLQPGPLLPAERKPIHFPWTVALTKPLHLFVVVHAESTYCSWIARIPWQSGSDSGVIEVDDEGRRFRLDPILVNWWERPGPDGEWIRTPNPRWKS